MELVHYEYIQKKLYPSIFSSFAKLYKDHIKAKQNKPSDSSSQRVLGRHSFRVELRVSLYHPYF